MTRILLVDDHQTFLAGTKMILEKHHFEVTTCSHGQAALEALKTSSFDIHLYDLKLPEINGFELSQKTLESNPEARIVILTGEDIVEHFDRLMDIGVSAVLEKSISEEELLMNLQLVQQEKMILPLQLVRKLKTKDIFHSTNSITIESPLKENEIKILKLVAQGLKNKDIANELYMSQRNIEYMLSHLFNKLKVASRQEAVLKAIELNLLKIDS